MQGGKGGLLLSTLDWIGFDLDHTIVRYNVPALEELIYRGFSRYMVSECGYPAALLNEPYDGLLASRGLVVDLNTGYALKMDLHHRVVKAYFGRKQIDSRTLAQEYPAPLEEFCGEHSERFLSINTYFESAIGLLWMNLIELLSRQSEPLDFQQMRTDLFGGFAFNFARFPEGFYFPEIIAHPDKYLFKRASVVRWLKHLRQSHGIKIFLLTNSNARYTQVLCDYCLGDNWTDLFDLVLFYGRKPGFWRQKDHPSPFLSMAWNPESGQYETQSQEPAEINLDVSKFYERGNVADLCKYLESSKPRSDHHHVAYVGDSIHGDCIECKRGTNWSTIAVIEELEHPSGTEFHSGNHPMWGNYFSTVHEHDEPVRTYWAEQVSQYVDLAVPCLSSLEDFLVDHDHQHTHDVLHPCAILPLSESSREKYYAVEGHSSL